MKTITFIFLFVLMTGLGANDLSVMEEDDNWVLREMETEILPELGYTTDQMIRIFDMDGNLISEYSYEKFIQNDLELSDVRIVLESEFLFDYGGDSYYLKS